MELDTLAALISAVTPILVPVLIMMLKSNVNKAFIPIVAILLGAVADIGNHVATGEGVGLVWGGVLGAAGVGLREVVDQLKKSMMS